MIIKQVVLIAWLELMLQKAKWYKKLYGDADPKTVVCDNCANGERYDDEDK